MSNAAIAGLAIATLLIGAGIGYLLARMGTNKESAKRNEVEKEFETYRESVNEHFSKTAGHFQNLGQQYRELYQHMAAGSQALCSPKDGDLALPFGASGVAGIGIIDPEEAPEPEVQAADESVDGTESSEPATPDEKIDEQPTDYAPAEAAKESAEAEALDTAAANGNSEPKANEEPTPDPLPKAESESTDRTLH